ncbi:hypothetical protein [Streptomyces sp. NPDC001404]|uniref:hypothetical protein n=1 Tax=Streptomyces sp. NPDC001404 TaxID=3364571 RepID=UPI0036828B95
MSTKPGPMVNLWMWIIRKRALQDSDDAGVAGFLGFLLWAGPAFGLAVSGSQMAKHGLPVWLAVIAPLVVWLFCLHFLVVEPERKATAVIRAKSFEPASIKARMASLRAALTEAATLSQDLEAQLDVSNASLQRIEAKVKKNRVLADMNQEVADAVADAWGELAAKENAKGKRFTIGVAVISLIAGGLVTLLATMFSGALTLH